MNWENDQRSGESVNMLSQEEIRGNPLLEITGGRQLARLGVTLREDGTFVYPDGKEANYGDSGGDTVEEIEITDYSGKVGDPCRFTVVHGISGPIAYNFQLVQLESSGVVGEGKDHNLLLDFPGGQELARLGVTVRESDGILVYPHGQEEELLGPGRVIKEVAIVSTSGNVCRFSIKTATIDGKNETINNLGFTLQPAPEGAPEQKEREKSEAELGEEITSLIDKLLHKKRADGTLSDRTRLTLNDMRGEITAMTTTEGLAISENLRNRRKGAFLSHSSDDRKFVERMSHALGEEGLRFWRDTVVTRSSEPVPRSAEVIEKKEDEVSASMRDLARSVIRGLKRAEEEKIKAMKPAMVARSGLGPKGVASWSEGLEQGMKQSGYGVIFLSEGVAQRPKEVSREITKLRELKKPIAVVSLSERQGVGELLDMMKEDDSPEVQKAVGFLKDIDMITLNDSQLQEYRQLTA